MYILSPIYYASLVPGAYPLWGMCTENTNPCAQPMLQSQSSSYCKIEHDRSTSPWSTRVDGCSSLVTWEMGASPSNNI